MQENQSIKKIFKKIYYYVLQGTKNCFIFAVLKKYFYEYRKYKSANAQRGA